MKQKNRDRTPNQKNYENGSENCKSKIDGQIFKSLKFTSNLLEISSIFLKLLVTTTKLISKCFKIN